MKGDRQSLAETEMDKDQVVLKENTLVKPEKRISTAFKSFKSFFTDDKRSNGNIQIDSNNR